MPASYDASGVLDVHSIFKTIQGEGPFCGERALFIRLYGCNLRCPGCDTEYTSKQTAMTPTALAMKVATEYGWPHGALIVLTGGEPMRQNVGPLIEQLLAGGYRVQVETNGILSPDNLPWHNPRFSVVCSPKTSRIHDKTFYRASAFKYVLRAGEVDPTDGLPTRALLHAAAPRVARPRAGATVYVQPMDEADPIANEANLAAAIGSTMEFGYRLQIQVHKQINME